jgi:hypothetical protein
VRRFVDKIADTSTFRCSSMFVPAEELAHGDALLTVGDSQCPVNLSLTFESGELPEVGSWVAL